jgi:sucrose-phosphate synthase
MSWVSRAPLPACAFRTGRQSSLPAPGFANLAPIPPPAVLNYGLSAEYAGATRDSSHVPDADRQLFTQYYLSSLLNLDENAIKYAWTKAASATNQGGGDKDARLQYLSWRIWHMQRKRADVRREQSRHMLEEDDSLLPLELSRITSAEVSDEEGDLSAGPASKQASSAATVWGSPSAPRPDLRVRVAPALVTVPPAVEGPLAPPSSATAAIESLVDDDLLLLAAPPDSAAPEHRLDRLYVIMISMHGLVRGDEMELGRDSDTGGQVKYVVELARALALHPWIQRVDLLTRLIDDPEVDASYAVPEERLSAGRGDLGGAFIVRLPCGPKGYIRKELLWPHVREFADRTVEHGTRTLAALADSGRRCELFCVHGHYADAGEAAALVAATMDTPLAVTGHSLGRNKLDHLMAQGARTGAAPSSLLSLACLLALRLLPLAKKASLTSNYPIPYHTVAHFS